MAVQLSIVIPVRNEQASIYQLLQQLKDLNQSLETEIIIVDDSDDDTMSILMSLQRNNPRLRVVHREGGERQGGLSTAVMLGQRLAVSDYIVILDADLQHPPQVIPQLYAAALRDDADIVIASRYRRGGSAAGLEGFSRKAISLGMQLTTRVVFPQLWNLSDPLSGFFLVKRSILAGIELKPIGYKILLEILMRCPWQCIAEVPYHFQSRLDGESKATMRQGVIALRHLARLYTDLPEASMSWREVFSSLLGTLTLVALFSRFLTSYVPLLAWLFAAESSVVIMGLTRLWLQGKTFELWWKQLLQTHRAQSMTLLLNLTLLLVCASFIHSMVRAELLASIITFSLGFLLEMRLAVHPDHREKEFRYAYDL